MNHRESALPRARCAARVAVAALALSASALASAADAVTPAASPAAGPAAVAAPAATGSATSPPASPDLKKGEQFYGKVCGRCHETGIGPVLKGRGMPDGFFIAFARNGMNAMPAFRVTDVDDATLAAVAAYLAASPAPEQKP